jgi:hypothetical protein
MNTFGPLSRRRLLRLGASSLLAAQLWPGALAAADAPSDPFRLFVLNDLHFLNDKCVPFFEKLIAQLKATKEKPDLCLIVGDLSENGAPEQIGPVKDLFNTLAIPVRVVCGNHDFRTNTDRKPYEDLFPNSINYYFEHRGWQFVALDTCQGLGSDVTIQPATLDFVDQLLPRLDKSRPMLLFTHFPLGPTVKYRPPNAEPLLNRFKEHNLQAVFNGHYHGFTERRINQTTLTTNRCCAFARSNHDGTREKGYFLCQARDGKVQREFVEMKL